MKAKMTKILLLVVALIICLSVALYAAHSYNSQAQVTTPTVTADDGQTIITPEKVDMKTVDVRKIR